jgi:hypothetical protein
LISADSAAERTFTQEAESCDMRGWYRERVAGSRLPAEG